MVTFIGAYSLTNVAGTILNNSNLSSNKILVASNSNNQSTSTKDETNIKDETNTSEETPSIGSTESKVKTSSEDTYKDGTYVGSAKGFKRGITEVSVTVTNGEITNIETLSNGDTPRYYQKVWGNIKNSIISKQSTSVDIISGATYSSKGIMNAVEDALNKAK